MSSNYIVNKIIIGDMTNENCEYIIEEKLSETEGITIIIATLYLLVNFLGNIVRLPQTITFTEDTVSNTVFWLC